MSNLFLSLFALVGTPLFVIIAALALLNFYRGGIDLSVVFIEMYRIAETPTLTAIPLFAFTGFLLAESKAANRLVAGGTPTQEINRAQDEKPEQRHRG